MSQVKINNKVDLILKIQENIKDLTQFKDDFGTHYTVNSLASDLKIIWKEIERKNFTSKSVQRAIELTLSILEGVYYDEVREHAAVLSVAFKKNFDARSAFMRVLDIYANLRAMQALYEFINENIKINADFVNTDIITFTQKAFDTLTTIADYYIQYGNIDKRQVLAEELDKYLSPYYDMIENSHEYLEGDIDEITAMLEANEDLARGTYNVLAAAIDKMWEHYNKGITFANRARLVLEKEAWNEEEQQIDVEKVDFNAIAQNLIEAYAEFKALQAFYDVLCNDTYELCFDDFQTHLDEALKNAKEALRLIAESYMIS
ncbi:hypothetical protein STSV1pORF15 [Sulfolobus virus STSV1]|uniref:hypothetical protein n=1 Tax=Sulfolobus virus STSV1 TaxID=285013 RepID=UPI000042B0FD|nr:hypothetical protein STSV1pORF15 [Sulfolobus virus STSV1]CAH04198.1 hypothetical protein [Sulfolobus virus STSV1]